MKDIQGEVFSDFEAPTTSDGSYIGRKKITDETEKHFNMKLEQEIAEINQRLKSSKTKVSLEATNGAIQLRATLPLKPGDIHKQGKNKKQYKISLGIPANFDGLKTAEEEAYELGKLIARQTFTWNDKYLGVRATKDKGITFREFYEIFEKKYFETRKRTMKSQGTFNKYKNKFKKYFVSDDVINEHNLKQIIAKVDSPAMRQEFIKLASIISTILKIEVSFKELSLKVVRKERNIPANEAIVSTFNTFAEFTENAKSLNKMTFDCCRRIKIIYALLAIYGLRPREIINQPDLGWLMSSENKHNTFKVHESNKTGYREIFPFVPEWIELFDLKNSENIGLLKAYTLDIKTINNLESKVSNIGHCFIRYRFGFKPYDLRHACAIRAHLQGVPIKAAADNLGHSVEMHTKVYQRWFGFENRIKAFTQAFAASNELEILQDEIGKLREEITQLKIENTRLRLITKASK
ncbi:MAG: site-specific integrase [Richelia sp. RM2_1_2]|nr:site-specific integrase [Richelia sp. SM1_7_0]NJN07166.1 site-specific integrase [Richelia sp. RM1_1_1]NJO29104.1 site-specific integrase [Richelia sp. SL_2_1]NJO57857.1 site-specific integrase [Richelia sp. RM2_1_2]